MRTLSLAATALAIALVAPSAAVATHTQDPAVTSALAWLRGIQEPDGSIGGEAGSAWAAIAFARAGVDPATVALPGGLTLAQRVLADTHPGLTAVGLERQVLAMAAAGLDPRAAPGFDAVAELLARFDGTQLGEPALLNDDIFGLQALRAAGVPSTDPVVQQVRAFVAQNQQPSGAWSFGAITAGPDLLFTVTFADVDMTAQGIAALVATGSSPDEPSILRATLFVRGNQGADGGCTWSRTGLVFDALAAPERTFQSNGASTSWAIMGLRAAGHDPQGPLWTSPAGVDLVGFLRSLQEPDGSFLYQPGVAGFSQPFTASLTAWGALALLGHGFVG